MTMHEATEHAFSGAILVMALGLGVILVITSPVWVPCFCIGWAAKRWFGWEASVEADPY